MFPATGNELLCRRQSAGADPIGIASGPADISV